MASSLLLCRTQTRLARIGSDQFQSVLPLRRAEPVRALSAEQVPVPLPERRLRLEPVSQVLRLVLQGCKVARAQHRPIDKGVLRPVLDICTLSVVAKNKHRQRPDCGHPKTNLFGEQQRRAEPARHPRLHRFFCEMSLKIDPLKSLVTND